MALSRKKLSSPPQSTSILHFFKAAPVPEGRCTISGRTKEDNSKSSSNHLKLKPRHNRLKRAKKAELSASFTEQSDIKCPQVIEISDSGRTCDDKIFMNFEERCSGAMGVNKDHLTTLKTTQEFAMGNSTEALHLQMDVCESADPVQVNELTPGEFTAEMMKSTSPHQMLFSETKKQTQVLKNTSLKPIVADISVNVAEILREYYTVSNTPALQHSTGSNGTNFKSGWREELPDEIRKDLLEEIQALNDQFPVNKFFSMLLKKRAEHEMKRSSLGFSVSGKRKSELEGQISGVSPKRRRSSSGMEEPMVGLVKESYNSPSVRLSGRNRLSRKHSRRQQTGRSDVMNHTIQNKTFHSSHDFVWKDCVRREDVLWTEKYQPLHSTEVIGNPVSVKKLHSWLKEWKVRADCEERRKRREKKLEEKSNESWDCGDFEGEKLMEENEDALCNTLLITGPSGVGKTAAVYACAQELGFKVFEVNCSSPRSGRLILSLLKEATQSHQVDTQGATALRPAFFSVHSGRSFSKPAASPREEPVKKVVASRKLPLSSRRAQIKKSKVPPPITLNHFFKMNVRHVNKPTAALKDPQDAARPTKVETAMKDFFNKASPTNLDTDHEVPHQRNDRKTVLSLILFEEVDIIFTEDVGFLAAIKSFMNTTKRPVVLTTSDPLFSSTFGGHLEEIRFKTPSLEDMRSYLQVLCLVENVRTDPVDVASLLTLNRGDVRQSVLQLQLWVRSGGGRQEDLPLSKSASSHKANVSTNDESTVSAEGKDKPLKKEELLFHLPLRDTGCTDSLMGFESKHDLKVILTGESWTASRECFDFLAESWKRRVDLLYSNMEVLLSLPTTSSPNFSQSQLKAQHTQRERVDEDVTAINHGPVTEFQPDKPFSRTKQHCFGPTVAQGNGVLLLRQSNNVLASPKRIHQLDSNNKHPSTEKQLSRLVSECLGSFAEFFENMSYLDSHLHDQMLHVPGPCGPRPIGWTGAELKDSLLDVPREEELKLCHGQSLAEMQAMVEGLGFHQCQTGISQAWKEAQRLADKLVPEKWLRFMKELTIPVPIHRHELSLCMSSISEPGPVKQRMKIIKALLSSRAFRNHGNKSAVATDYLPALRTFCRSERVKEQGKRRFLHYLRRIQLHLPKSTLQQLHSGFP